ncbi:hypothetical protein J6590_001863 [Homalodisca vitripennis]|nr:hypothetical protein J6590_001863 [Homalodisca vitripennis]
MVFVQPPDRKFYLQLLNNESLSPYEVDGEYYDRKAGYCGGLVTDGVLDPVFFADAEAFYFSSRIYGSTTKNRLFFDTMFFQKLQAKLLKAVPPVGLWYHVLAEITDQFAKSVLSSCDVPRLLKVHVQPNQKPPQQYVQSIKSGEESRTRMAARRLGWTTPLTKSPPIAVYQSYNVKALSASADCLIARCKRREHVCPNNEEPVGNDGLCGIFSGVRLAVGSDADAATPPP